MHGWDSIWMISLKLKFRIQMYYNSNMIFVLITQLTFSTQFKQNSMFLERFWWLYYQTNYLYTSRYQISLSKYIKSEAMSVYCWGNTTHGELGLGGIEDEQVRFEYSSKLIRKLVIYYIIILDRYTPWNDMEPCRRSNASCLWGNSYIIADTKWESLFLWKQWFWTIGPWTIKKKATYVYI